MTEPAPMTKERLEQYIDLRIEIERQEERIMRGRARLESPAKKLDGMPRSNYAVDRMSNGVGRIVELEEIRETDLARLKKEAAAIETAINMLPEAFQREFMRTRYMDGASLAEIAGRHDKSFQWAFWAHQRIIKEMEKILI
jgi:DNA-directed RNA polymerase specialized sigma24 family protein